MPIKLLIAYNVKLGREEEYYRFVMGEFLPTAQSIGLEIFEAWHTVWGDYPERLIAMAADSQTELNEILNSERWREMETKLGTYVNDYQRLAVPFQSGFQFFKPREG
jgi:hypothetical protein